MSIKYSLTILILIALIFSCKTENGGNSQFERVKPAMLPTSYGNIDQAIIIANKDYMDGKLGKVLESKLNRNYPLLPQAEPIMDFKAYTFEDFDKRKREYRNIIIVSDLKGESELSKFVMAAIGKKNLERAQNDPLFFTVAIKDIWARNQQVVFVFGQDEDIIASSIEQNGSHVLSIVELFERQKVKDAAYANGVDPQLTEKVFKKLAVKIDIPKGYQIAYEDENTIWLRYDNEPKITSNLIIHQRKATGVTENESARYLLRNELGGMVHSALEGDFMRTDTIISPQIDQIFSTNYLITRARGLWRFNKDFSGGPFTNHSFIEKDSDRLIMLDGFVLAPGKKKRLPMRKIEAIFLTTRF